MENFINKNLEQYLSDQKISQDGIAKIKHIYFYILSLINDENLYPNINEYVEIGQELDFTAIFFDNLIKPNEYENYLKGIECLVELDRIDNFVHIFKVKKVFNKTEVLERLTKFGEEIR